MSSFADELCHQGLLDDIISFDSNPSTVDDASAMGGSDDSLRRTTTPVDGLQACIKKGVQAVS
jgi:hypothetical protein